jgi:hypothetical protein
MMYSNKFAVAVKIDDKVLREDDGKIIIPFGLEYTLMLRNLNSKKAVVKVSIDGQDVLDNKRLIVQPNDSLELKGFLKGHDATHNFKFIERTKEVEDYRGIEIEDGLIRVEYWFEKDVEYTTYTTPFVYRTIWWDSNDWYSHTDSFGALNTPDQRTFGGSGTSMSCNYSSLESSYNINDSGITVHGDDASQHFNSGYTNTLESLSSVIVLRLIGTKDNKVITTREKIQCSSCGKMNKTYVKFCPNCGTRVNT